MHLSMRPTRARLLYPKIYGRMLANIAYLCTTVDSKACANFIMSTPRRSARIQSNPAPPQPLQAHPQQHQQQQQQGHMDRWSLPDGYERYIIFAVITVALGFVEPMNTLYGYYHQLCPECRDGFAIRECLATDSSITAKIPPRENGQSHQASG